MRCMHALARGIITQQNISDEICELAAGLKPGRRPPDEITVFTSTGLAVQDAVTADLVYNKVLAKGIGKIVEIV